MNITILSIGKFGNSLFKPSYDDYFKRIKGNIILKELELKKSNLSIKQTIAKEGELLLNNIKNDSYLIALDENGTQFSSSKFANFLQETNLQGLANITFIIGGSNGLDQLILQKVHKKISLGKMTFPHMMVRSILIEQIYRAQCILSNHPYHK